MNDSIGSIIDRMFHLREEKRYHERVAEERGADIKRLEYDLLARLEAENVTQSRGEFATATRSDLVVPKVESWTEFHHFIESGPSQGESRIHLLHKRVSTAAVRELFEKGRPVPGVVPETISKINLRKVSK